MASGDRNLFFLHGTPSLAVLGLLRHHPTTTTACTQWLAERRLALLASSVLVAQAMNLIGESHKPDFVVSAGDNFYRDGLPGACACAPVQR